MKLEKWGDDLAVRLPSAVIKALQLSEGDALEVTVVDARTVQIQKRPTARELFDRIRPYRGRLPADFGFSRDEASR